MLKQMGEGKGRGELILSVLPQKANCIASEANCPVINRVCVACVCVCVCVCVFVCVCRRATREDSMRAWKWASHLFKECAPV